MTKPPTAARTGPQPAPPAAPAAASPPPNRGGKGRPGKRKGGRDRTGTTTGTAGAAQNGRGRPGADAAALLRRLTAREAEAFAHLAAGRDLAETATALGVTPTTARSYQHRALRKLGTRTQAEIAALAALLPAPPGAGAGAASVPASDSAPASAPASASAGAGAGAADPASAAAAAKAGAGGDGRRPAAPGDAPGRKAVRSRPAAAAPTAGPARTGPAAARPAAAGTPVTPVPDPKPARTRPDAVGAAEATAAQPPGTASASAPTRPTRTGRGPEPRATGVTAESGTRSAPAPAADRTATGPTPATAGRPGRTDRGTEARPTGKAAETEARSGPAPAPAAGRPPAVFEEVYEAGHTRLVQQVFLLTACKHRAVHCVGRAFGEARRHWPEPAAGAGPEQWVRMRAFELALSPWHRGGPRRAHAWRLPHRRIKVRPADEAQAVLPDHDRLTDRDRALLKALRRLSRPQRRALVLHDGLGLPADAVAVEVESTVAAAQGRVWAARAALAQWVPDLVGPDPTADGFADRLSGLLHRAAVRGVPEPHRPPVPLLRARQGLVHVSRTGAAALLTVAVGGAVAATLAGGGPGELFRPSDPPPPVLCAPVPTLATEPDALLPLLQAGAPSGIHSLWCSPTPGLEPVVVDPPPPRTDGPYRPPAGGRAGVVLPPPAAVAPEPPGCASWVLRPCPAEHLQPR
ncbi:LuxR C-terminal-related transcriptional regulator [Kitasatospora purpeofusca]|uniref:LuxR C-terminal-related transcriptional regulator n=1 Tax=Kitasatospora purpeofusca TaxID=67352 RepID=UPI002E12206B|nr:LuxR C-terminal-related transcriptional regulator [Kitasatospora purpeofusca]WSR40846.1 LuxR C-terminal-related transcriptional regulator [Kitasatospora purpeofusca]